MSLVDQLDAKLFARRDKQFDQNLQMENLKLKTTIAANDAQFKQGNLNIQNQQLINNQHRANALTQLGMANLALKRNDLDLKKTVAADDKAYKNRMLNINEAQFGEKLNVAKEQFDENLDQRKTEFDFKSGQDEQRLKSYITNQNLIQDRYGKMTPYAVQSAETASKVGEFNLATQQRNQPLRDSILQNQAADSSIRSNYLQATAPYLVEDYLYNRDQGRKKDKYAMKALGREGVINDLEIQQLKEMMKNRTSQSGLVTEAAKQITPIQAAVDLGMDTKNPNLQTFIGIAMGGPQGMINVAQGLGKRGIRNYMKSEGFTNFMGELENSGKILRDPNSTANAKAAASQVMTIAMNNSKDLPFSSRQKKSIARLARNNAGFYNFALKNQAMLNNK